MKEKCNSKANEKCLDCQKCLILKYVRFDLTDFAFAPSHVPHASLKISNKKPISAGFVNMSKMQVFGHSEGLQLKPKRDDIEILKVLLRGNL